MRSIGPYPSQCVKPIEADLTSTERPAAVCSRSASLYSTPPLKGGEACGRRLDTVTDYPELKTRYVLFKANNSGQKAQENEPAEDDRGLRIQGRRNKNGRAEEK